MASPESLAMDLKMGELSALFPGAPSDCQLKVSKTAIALCSKVRLFKVPLKKPLALPYPG